MLINIHMTVSLCMHACMHAQVYKGRTTLLGSERIYFHNYSGFFFSGWIVPINFNFTWQLLTAKTKAFFFLSSILLKPIGQECCCHLQTQDYICTPSPSLSLSRTHIHTQCKHQRRWNENEMTLHVCARSRDVQDAHTHTHTARHKRLLCLWSLVFTAWSNSNRVSRLTAHSCKKVERLHEIFCLQN